MGGEVKNFRCRNLFVSPIHLQEFFSLLRKYFLKAQLLAGLFLRQVSLTGIFLEGGKSHPPPPTPR